MTLSGKLRLLGAVSCRIVCVTGRSRHFAVSVDKSIIKNLGGVVIDFSEESLQEGVFWRRVVDRGVVVV